MWHVAELSLNVLGLLGQNHTDTLLCIDSVPNAVLATLSPLITRSALAASDGLAHHDLQIALLGAEPVLDEVGRVLTQRTEEVVFGLGYVDRLNDCCQLVVQGCHLFEHVGICGIVQECRHSLAEGAFHQDAHIVNSRLRVLVEILVDPNGVRKLDRGKRLQRGGNISLKQRNGPRLNATKCL